jgi:hypothetical protein
MGQDFMSGCRCTGRKKKVDGDEKYIGACKQAANRKARLGRGGTRTAGGGRDITREGLPNYPRFYHVTAFGDNVHHKWTRQQRRTKEVVIFQLSSLSQLMALSLKQQLVALCLRLGSGFFDVSRDEGRREKCDRQLEASSWRTGDSYI